MHLLNTLPQRLDPGATPTFAGLTAPSLTAPASTDLTLTSGLVGTNKVNFPDTLAASSATVGAVTIGNGTAATNVGIGGGKINVGSTEASNSSTTGALQVAGGIYAGAASVFGSTVTVGNSGYYLKTADANNMAAIFGYSDTGTTHAWKIAFDAINLQIGANANVPVEIVSNNVRAALFSPTAATFAGAVSVSGTAATWTSGTGSPESVKTAPVGSLYTRTDGGASTTLYVKESGAGNTGWIAK